MISSLISSLTHSFFQLYVVQFPHTCVFPICLPMIDFQFHTVVVQKNAWYNLYPLKFAETFFMAWHVIYPGESSSYIWKECIFFWFWIEWPVNSYLHFLFGWSAHWCAGMLKSPTVTVLQSMSLFLSDKICFIYVGAPILGSYMLINIVSSSCIDSFIIM